MNGNDLTELFERDPCHLTDPDVDKIIARMRQAQAQYELGAKAPPKTEKPKKSTKTENLLKDLGLA